MEEMTNTEFNMKRVEEGIEEYLKEPEGREKKKPLRKEKVMTFILAIIFLCLTAMCLLDVFGVIRDVFLLNPGKLSSGIRNLVMGAFGALCVVVSSAYEKYNYHRTKMLIYGLTLTLFFLSVIKVSAAVSLFVLSPVVLKIPLNKEVTAEMVVMLLRTLTVIGMLLVSVPLGIKYYGCFFSEEVKRKVIEFRILNHVDLRKNRKNLYDIKAIRHMDNGSFYRIKQNDRFLHMMLDGPTGSGKTSLETVKVASDIDRKYKNTDKTKQKLFKMLKDGKAYVNRSFKDEDFNVRFVSPKEGHEKEYEKIIKKYGNVGLTIVAPDSSLTDKVYDYCMSKGIKCNRIDPLRKKGTDEKKEGYRGFNPLYISKDVPDYEFNQQAVKKATLMSDVLNAIYESKGKSDPYFAGVNRSVTTSITILLEKTFGLVNPGKTPTPKDVQSLINDFSRISPYYNEFMKLKDAHEFEFVTDLIRNDLLGSGAKNMNEQIRGLRTIFSEFLTHPLIRDILCSEDTIDMDRILSDGEVTVVNYALELGDSTAVGFGLFFILNFIDAVFRRPGDGSAMPHFFDIDEFPVVLHPQMERCFSLFRKYNVGMTIMIQSLDQMSKSDVTKYMRGVLLGNCGTHVVYNRASTTEMRLYSELAGEKEVETVQKTVSETAITQENPSYSYSKRMVMEQKAELDPKDIRNRAFQEVTVFGVRNGAAVPEFHGRTFFLDEERFEKIKRKTYDWEKFHAVPLDTRTVTEHFKTNEPETKLMSKTTLIDMINGKKEQNTEMEEEKITDIYEDSLEL